MPKHTLLTDEEKEELLKERKISDHQLKKILVTDPVNRYYCGKKGQIYRIERESEVSGKSIEYRIVD